MMTMVTMVVTMVNLLARATPSSLLFPSFTGAVLAASPGDEDHGYHEDDYYQDYHGQYEDCRFSVLADDDEYYDDECYGDE